MGDLVYYYRRGRKQGSRYGGRWYGPARVLCHENAGDPGVNANQDGVFWMSESMSDERFAHFVGTLSVIEMSFPISPRDVHKSHGVWVVNQKARKNIEVSLKKLEPSDRAEFQRAMSVEANSFLTTEAIRICERAGIPKERIMKMRFVLTWKPILDSEGNQTGRKAKARLIVRGFEDPDLLEVDRESPTLSAMGRNLLLTQCAQRKYPVSVGDIRTAFLPKG